MISCPQALLIREDKKGREKQSSFVCTATAVIPPGNGCCRAIKKKRDNNNNIHNSSLSLSPELYYCSLKCVRGSRVATKERRRINKSRFSPDTHVHVYRFLYAHIKNNVDFTQLKSEILSAQRRGGNELTQLTQVEGIKIHPA